MRRTIYIILLFMAVVLFAGCTGCDKTETFSQADVNTSSFSNVRDTADSLYNCMQFRDAYDLYQQMLDDATQTGNDYYRSLVLMSMGQDVFYEGDREKGIRYVNEAIGIMAKTDRADADHLTHGFLIILARLYGEMKDYGNALKTNERNLQLTMEGTRWGDGPNVQLMDRRMTLAKMVAVLAKMGNFQRADSVYAAWKAVQYEGNLTRDNSISGYMKQRDSYQESENTRHHIIIFFVVAAMIAMGFYAVKEARQKRIISLKNQSLVAQITEALSYKKKYWDEKRAQTLPTDDSTDLNALTDEQLFKHIHEVIVRDRLYLDPNFGRQALMDRFKLTKERAGAVFSKGSEHAKMSNYIQQLRLDYAAHLLVYEPERSIVDIAAECGFGSNAYFSRCFRQRFSISPTDYRHNASETMQTYSEE